MMAPISSDCGQIGAAVEGDRAAAAGLFAEFYGAGGARGARPGVATPLRAAAGGGGGQGGAVPARLADGSEREPSEPEGDLPDYPTARWP